VVSPENLEQLAHCLSSPDAKFALDTFCANLIAADSSVDSMADNFESMVYNFVTPIGRVSQTRSSQGGFPTNEWYDEECKTAKLMAHNASRRGDWDAYMELKQEYNRIVQRKKRDHQSEASDKLRSLFAKDRAEIWKTLAKYSQTQTKCPIDLDEFLADMESENVAPIDPTDDMDDFVKQYVEVPLCDEAILNVLDRPVRREEISQACSELKKGKSCGADGIPLSIIQCFASITSVLTLMFNVILTTGEYPARWIEGMITPILKPGKDARQTSSYRKVTVIPHVGKLFEKVMENRLANFESLMGSDDMLNNGFSRGFRPTDNLVIMDCLIRKYRFIRRPLFVAFIDFTQAFDLVNRNGLFYKLILLHFGSKALKVIYSMYKKSQSAFRLNGRFTKSIRTLLGVNQGSILSPRLFKKFFQDLASALHAPGAYLNDLMIKYLLWADDLVLFATTAEDLQRQLEHLEAYCKKWKVRINPSKTRVMVFDNIRGKKCVAEDTVFKLDGCDVRVTNDDVIYLGVAFNSKHENHFKTHVDFVCKKAQRSLFRIYSLCKNVGALPPQLAFHLFDSLVLSVLRYGSEVWYTPSTSCGKRIEIVHLKFLRYILGVRRSTPTPALYGETGRVPLSIEFRSQAVKYASTLFERRDLSPRAPLHVARVYMAECESIGRRSWLTNVVALSDAVTVQQLVSRNLRYSLWRSTVNALSKAEWQLSLADSSKLRTYRLFKFDLCFEPYLSKVSSNKQRKSLTRFRVSSHNLAIERMRWTRTPVEQRLCQACGVIEDERHVLMMCGRYSGDRERLFMRLAAEFPLTPHTVDECFVRIMTAQSTEGCRTLACFVHAALTIHADG
jgi:hypothetical protein